ncbi:MAG: CcdB family protein [Sulfuricella sp.]|nr:CcdB family protein [Sulfuricella sp.]
MARFGVYANPTGTGYLLDVQADLLSQLNTRVVVPLLPLDAAPAPIGTLNPLFEIDGAQHSMVTQYLAAVLVGTLKAPLFNTENRRGEITAALDLLFQGF